MCNMVHTEKYCHVDRCEWLSPYILCACDMARIVVPNTLSFLHKMKSNQCHATGLTAA